MDPSPVVARRTLIKAVALVAGAAAATAAAARAVGVSSSAAPDGNLVADAGSRNRSTTSPRGPVGDGQRSGSGHDKGGDHANVDDPGGPTASESKEPSIGETETPEAPGDAASQDADHTQPNDDSTTGGDTNDGGGDGGTDGGKDGGKDGGDNGGKDHDGSGEDPMGPPPIVETAAVPVGGGVVIAQYRVVVTQPLAGRFRCFSSRCTHAGCTVDTVENGVIHCPCHGSLFDANDGDPIGGPAPTPLEQVGITVKNGGVFLN